MAKVSASPPPDPAPDPGPPAEKAMELDQEALVVPGGFGSSSPGLLMEEFVMGDPARLVASMRLAMELAGSSRLFAKLFDLFASTPRSAMPWRASAAAAPSGSASWPTGLAGRGTAGRRGSASPSCSSCATRSRTPLAKSRWYASPTAAPVERRAMEELGCVVTASAQQCRPVHEPTLIFMPYPDRVFFENLLTLNWSAEQLGKIVLLGHSFSTMVKVLELSMSKQEKFGVTEQREKAKRVMAIQQYVREIKLCAEIDGLLDSPLWEDDSPDPFQKREHLEDDDSEDCECMHCAACSERYAMISALPSNSTTMVWSRVNVRMNYDTQLAGWHLNPSDAYIEGKDIKEATSIVKEVRTTMLDVRSSSLYRKFVNQLKENPSIVDRISRMLGAHDCMELVIYGLGSFEFDVKSQYQLALALLLKEDEVLPIGDIEIYDPELSPADVRACFDLGIRVLLVNEQCQRSVEKPTLFYVPGLKLGANLLESNFSPKQKMILVSYGFKDSGESISGVIENWNFGSTSIRDSLGLERDRFVWVTKDYIRGVLSMGKSDERLIGISELKLEFLEVDDDMGIYSKLPRLKLKEKVYLNFMREMEYNSFLAFDHVASLRVQLEERISSPFREDRPGYMADDPPLWRHVFCHRLPAKNRTTWSPPPKGWIKLNFHGIGCSKGRPAGIGGILHNDKGQVLSYYAGPVGDVDQIVASAMALEVGLQNIIELHEPVYKLIVEGDDLKVIRCFNGVSSPPKRYSVAFSYIYHDMCLRPTKKPDAEKLPEECNSGKDDDDGSKDDDNSDHRKDKNKDDDDSQGASSESGIPPGWTRREFIAWHVEEAANLATGLAQTGVCLPRFRRHNSAKCKCGHEMDVKSDKPDITWFPHEDEKMGKWTLRATSRTLHGSLMRMRRWGRGLKVLMK
ncbi:unnamed protein product [Urochloa decumbens]|uniref:SRR1-like domain-containing protein n=1 Tax=Urochloa decumbens TaxID=240449 RepID=A0ABC9F7D9_9POAL